MPKPEDRQLDSWESRNQAHDLGGNW